jgi:hypothetical protein
MLASLAPPASAEWASTGSNLAPPVQGRGIYAASTLPGVGNRNVKVLPTPSLLSTEIVPP